MKKYYIFAFSISWVIMVLASLYAVRFGAEYFQITLAGVMFVPMLSVILSGGSLKGMGWKPVFKGRMKYWLIAWFLPGLLVIPGAALFFLLFPGSLDFTGSMLIAQGGQEVLDALKAQGLSYPMYLAVTAVQCLIYIPLINMIPACGEESAWRGYMTPYLKKKYGRDKGLVLSGLIWGVWHWPLIILAGYEYGTQYFGAPVLGPMLFCLITVSLGILMDYVYERTQCIWVPAIMHGSFNAWATFPGAMLNPAFIRFSILGPAPVGILSALPLIIFSFMILKRKGRMV
ncbi:MAG: CPBP family intramembrane metalloprotease [Solobacterium sp.]|nr:CPBP family intramembrane metalloprotease [Solobacterium sp.]